MCFTVRIDVPLSFKAFRLSLLIIIFYVQNQPTASQWSSQRGAALLSVSQNRSYRCGKRTRRAKASVKITRPFQPPRPWHPLPPPLRPGPLLPTPSVRCSRPRVSICGQCTLLYEPRPFTEGPRNATALNNHPLEDRRPCALERAQEAQENKVGIRIRQIAQRKRGGRVFDRARNKR